MRVLVISDSHGRRTTMEDVVTVCSGPNAPDLVVHLGGSYRRRALYPSAHQAAGAGSAGQLRLVG